MGDLGVAMDENIVKKLRNSFYRLEEKGYLKRTAKHLTESSDGDLVFTGSDNDSGMLRRESVLTGLEVKDPDDGIAAS